MNTNKEKKVMRATLGRRLAAGLAATALTAMSVVGLAGTAAAAPTSTCHPFPDVTSANQHCDNIAWLKNKGITKPADGQFHPDAVVTRRQMAAFLFRLFNPDNAEPGRAYLPWAVYYGRMAATPGGTPTLGADADGDLQPDAAVSRAAMAAILHADSAGYGWTVGFATGHHATTVGVDADS